MVARRPCAGWQVSGGTRSLRSPELACETHVKVAAEDYMDCLITVCCSVRSVLGALLVSVQPGCRNADGGKQQGGLKRQPSGAQAPSSHGRVWLGKPSGTATRTTWPMPRHEPETPVPGLPS